MRPPIRVLAATSLAVALITTPVFPQSVFEELYPPVNGSVTLPMPFGELLNDLSKRSAGAELQVAFVPLGRSLQRLAAEPEFFASPRIIVAVTRNGASGPLLRSRLFLGYQPAVSAIEIIAFDNGKGRFVFQEVSQYEAGKSGALVTHADTACTACHQAHGPIFAAAPWQETNANPVVVAALAPTHEGVSVKLDFDGIDMFSRSARDAARLQAAVRLWREGCENRACRAALIIEAIRLSHPGSKIAQPTHSQVMQRELAQNLPRGIALPSFKIPDYNPVQRVSEGTPAADAVLAQGVYDPTTPRLDETLWRDDMHGLQRAAELVIELFDPDLFAQFVTSQTPAQLAAFTQNLQRLASSEVEATLLDGALSERESLMQLLQQSTQLGEQQ